MSMSDTDGDGFLNSIEIESWEAAYEFFGAYSVTDFDTGELDKA